MENFIDINRKINELKEKLKNVDDYKTFKQLFEEITNDIWPIIYNGTMSITFNFFSLVLSFLSIKSQTKERFIEQQMEESDASYESESVISTSTTSDYEEEIFLPVTEEEYEST